MWNLFLIWDVQLLKYLLISSGLALRNKKSTYKWLIINSSYLNWIGESINVDADEVETCCWFPKLFLL